MKPSLISTDLKPPYCVAYNPKTKQYLALEDQGTTHTAFGVKSITKAMKVRCARDWDNLYPSDLFPTDCWRSLLSALDGYKLVRIGQDNKRKSSEIIQPPNAEYFEKKCGHDLFQFLKGFIEGLPKAFKELS